LAWQSAKRRSCTKRLYAESGIPVLVSLELGAGARAAGAALLDLPPP
jgi:hypothetical protein